MASIFGSKSKSFMTMSISPQGESSISRSKPRDKKVEESWALLEDISLYDNESWNDPRDFARPVKICSGPHDTQYCMENPEEAFVEYASSRTDEAGGEQNRNSSSPKRVHFVNTITIVRKEDEPEEEVEEEEEEDDPEYINTNPPSPPNPSNSFIIEKVSKLNSFLESLNLVPQSSNTQFICTKENDGDIMFVEIIKKYNDSSKGELEEDESAVTGELGI
ncbi:hypothetical protein Tco_1284649 [Tanacetum coccineum]